MSMETFICPKCKRQGCWTEEGEFDYVCKCGHSVQVEPQLTDLCKSDLIAKIYTTENQRDRLAMRCAELESAITEAVDAAVAQERAKYAGKVIEWRKQAWTGEGSEQYRMGRGHCADELESLVKNEVEEK